MEVFISNCDNIVSFIASLVIYLLEIIGILVILVGAGKAIWLVFSDSFFKKHHNVKISLGNSLALGLEFKMGAEIIKTVIVRDLQELAILGAIILLRAILAVMIHWEIKVERKDELESLKEKNNQENNQSEQK